MHIHQQNSTDITLKNMNQSEHRKGENDTEDCIKRKSSSYR